MRNVSNYCNVIFFAVWRERELHRLQNIWGNNIDIDDTALRANVCYFQHTAVRWVHDTELRILWEKGKIKVIYILVFPPSFFQQDF